jgi:hypothetical protein
VVGEESCGGAVVWWVESSGEEAARAGSAALGELGRCQRTGVERDWSIGSVGNPTVFRHARRSAG